MAHDKDYLKKMKKGAGSKRVSPKKRTHDAAEGSLGGAMKLKTVKVSTYNAPRPKFQSKPTSAVVGSKKQVKKVLGKKRYKSAKEAGHVSEKEKTVLKGSGKYKSLKAKKAKIVRYN